MSTILCYGDSNTWGYIPGGTGRHGWDTRWPGVLQNALGPEYHVVEEGLNGRTTCIDDPQSEIRKGLAYLPVSLGTHFPIRLLIIMLGTNDTKYDFGLTAEGITQGVASLVQCAKEFEPAIPDILLVSPSHIIPTADPEISARFRESIPKSLQLAEHYRQLADENGCHFWDAASVAKSSPVDGIHLDAENHKLLGQGIAEKAKVILG
jgi:lysophospholipase L1-like esterase